jgi:hypothetical protein
VFSPERFDEEAILRIAVLGWGSLVWERRELNTAAEFTPNGPLLPVEFCRISADGRLTLAIDEDFGDVCTTYSAPSAFADLDGAIENLRQREGTIASEIGFVAPASRRQNGVAMERHPQAAATIAAWAEASGYDAAIWTALESNFDDWDRAGEPFSVTAAIRYLEALAKKDAEAFARALDYIRKAPSEVETPVRDEVAKRWPA